MNRTACHRTMGVCGLIALTCSLIGVVSQQATAETAFSVGSGRAEAKFLKVGPSRGALSLAPQVGLALSDFLNTRGRGDVRTADFAALSDSLPPEVTNALPAVKVESTDEGAEQGKTVTLGTPPPVPVALSAVELHADAGRAPRGASSFKVGSADIGVGTILGGRAEARSGIVNGNVREATARVLIPRIELAGGVVVLENLEWSVLNRSGASTNQEAKFSLGSVAVAGQSFAAPPGSEQPLKDVVAALKPVLGPLGIDVTFPTPRIEGGVVELSPLRLRVAKSALGPVVNPVVEQLQPVRAPLVDAIRAGTDQADAAILLADVAIGVLAGGSTLDLDIGGASVFTVAAAPGFAFGAREGGPAPLSAPTGASFADTPTRATGSTGPDFVAAVSASATGNASGNRRTGDLAARPASSSANRGGPLLFVGLLGLAAALTAAGADYRRIVNGRRLIPARS